MSSAGVVRGDSGAGAGLLAVLAVGALLGFSGTFNRSLWVPDEPRVAEIGREMFLSGDFVVPTIGGERFLEKPPLYWWGMVGAFQLFGVSIAAARTTSVIACILLLLVVYDTTRRVAGVSAGVLAAVVLATTSKFVGKGLTCTVDSWLALFVGLAYWGFVVAEFESECRERETRRGRGLAIGVVAVHAGVGLAFLTKGPVGMALALGPPALALLAMRRWAFFRSRWHAPAALVSVGCCVLWPALLYARGGWELTSGFLVDNLLWRFLPPEDGDYVGGHVAPLMYYLPKIPEVLFPWIIAAPAVVAGVLDRRLTSGWNRQALVFLLAIFPIGAALLSIPGTKRSLYLLPLIAPLACVTGVWMAASARAGVVRALDRVVVALLFAGVAFAGVAGAVLAVLVAARSEWLGLPRGVWEDLPVVALVVGLAGAAAVLVGGVVVALRRQQTREREARWWLAGLLATTALANSLLLNPLRDSRQGTGRVAEEIVAMRASGATLFSVGLGPDEPVHASVLFRTGERIEVIGDASKLRRRLAAESGALVLSREVALAALPADLVEALRPPEMTWTIGPRTYTLSRLRTER